MFLVLGGYLLYNANTATAASCLLATRLSGLDSLILQSMVMQKKLRKVISYVSRVQYLPLEGPSPKGTLDVALLKCFRTIPGVGSEV